MGVRGSSPPFDSSNRATPETSRFSDSEITPVSHERIVTQDCDSAGELAARRRVRKGLLPRPPRPRTLAASRGLITAHRQNGIRIHAASSDSTQRVPERARIRRRLHLHHPVATTAVVHSHPTASGSSASASPTRRRRSGSGSAAVRPASPAAPPRGPTHDDAYACLQAMAERASRHAFSGGRSD
jgi:hypothetical protein